jgi:hypothetical protein
MIALIIALFVLLLPRPAAAQAATEWQVEAAILFKLPQFVQWPAAVLNRAPSIRLCVPAGHPFAPELDAFVSGETLNGRPLHVQGIEDEELVGECHVLFVPREPAPAGARLVRRARGRPILTVGESDSFLDSGGIVRLRTVSGRMRFDVNLDAARAAGIRFSSQLLALAASVRGAP